MEQKKYNTTTSVIAGRSAQVERRRPEESSSCLPDDWPPVKKLRRAVIQPLMPRDVPVLFPGEFRLPRLLQPRCLRCRRHEI
jgi:hypothetical protein